MNFDNSLQYSRQAVYFRLTPLEYKQTINYIKINKDCKSKNYREVDNQKH